MYFLSGLSSYYSETSMILQMKKLTWAMSFISAQVQEGKYNDEQLYGLVNSDDKIGHHQTSGL
jgi:hypothetical protein